MSTPEVILISGLASKGANLAPLRTIAETVANGEPVSYVDGGHIEDDKLVVSSPLDQMLRAIDIIEKKGDKDFVVVSHCMGAVAALTLTDFYASDRVRTIMLSPPLRDPLSVLHNPHIQGRVRPDGGTLYMPSSSFALAENGPSLDIMEPARLTYRPELAAEIEFMSDCFKQRTQGAVDKGRLSVILPEEDWNTQAAHALADSPHVIHVPGPHSFHTDDVTLRETAASISYISRHL